MIDKQKDLHPLKIRRSPPRQGPQGANAGLRAKLKKKPEEGDKLNFTSDMKRLGIMADIQGVQEEKKKLIIK